MPRPGSEYSLRRSTSQEIECEMRPMLVTKYSDWSFMQHYLRHNWRRKWVILVISVVSFVTFMLFSSAHGFDHEGMETSQHKDVDGFAEVPQLSTFQVRRNNCRKRDVVANKTIWNAAVEKSSHLLDDMFTIALQTYKRPAQLNATLGILTAYRVPSLYEIVVVWNDVDTEPPTDFVGENRVPVRYRRSERNSLNQKLLPDPNYKTQGVLLSDDDWSYHTTGDLEYAFQQWRRAGMHRLTGAFARYAYLNDMGLLTYTLSNTTMYNLVLSGLAFTHMSFLEYYHSDDQLMENLRGYVDRFSNCEDIALNFVASMLTCEGPLLVLGRDALIRQPDDRGISKTPGHVSKRNHCLREFTNWFTYIPLQSVSGWTRRGAEVIG